MLKLMTGNLLRSGAQALVNPVNCVGVMGKGLALQFKQKYPENFSAYAEACANGKVQPGKMFVYHEGDTIINFPTKRHWRDVSRIEDIQAGIPAMLAVVRQHTPTSVAIPALGCGLGGLDWAIVYRLLVDAVAASGLDDVDFLVYPPQD